MDRMSQSDRMAERLENLLHDDDPRLRIYVYRVRDGRKTVPALMVGEPFPGLHKYLQDRYGTATYWIMIRRGRQMEWSGSESILAPLGWRSPSG